MTNSAESALSVLWFAPRSKAAERLAARFHVRMTDGVGPAGTRIVAAGARASEALRAALASPGAYSAIALMSPPALDRLDADVAARLREIDCPVLALFGTDDGQSPPSFGHDWRRGLPKCFQTFVFGAGANMADERPDAVAAIISDFLTRGEGFLVKATDDRLHD